LLPCGLNIFRLFSWLDVGFNVYVHYLIPELRSKIATHPTGKPNEKYVLKQLFDSAPGIRDLSPQKHQMVHRKTNQDFTETAGQPI
jgi:hypothetical protein